MPYSDPLFPTFLVSKLIPEYVTGNIILSSFQKSLFLSNWAWFDPQKLNSHNTSQKVQNEGAKMKCDLSGNFWRSSSTPHWAHDSSLEISFCLVIIWLIKKFIWIISRGYKLIFPRSLQKCSNSFVSIVFLTFLQNHNTCVKSEGYFSSLEYYG